MEKGNTKGSSKSNSADSKSKQDVPGKYHRLQRVKDNVSPRPDIRSKPAPPRNREKVDKRPRNRNGAVYEKYRSEMTEGAVGKASTKQGCKKTNLNHLLNFTLAPLDNWEGGGRRPAPNRHKLPKYNKELFLQANCQFVARDDGDYSIHQKNPDILVEWSLIEEIRLSCHEVPLCPICLYVPVAAKITRCGHVYCWPCMLHYLALTDKTWQKCPICFEAVHKTELKSVSLCVKKSFAVGEEITLYLMKREKGTLLSVPVTQQKLPDSLCNVQNVDSVTRYQKLLLAPAAEVQLILDRERIELRKAYDREKDTPEACFIESALKLLDEREQNLHQMLDNEKQHIIGLTKKYLDVNERKRVVSVSSTESNEDCFHLEVNDNFTKGENCPSLTSFNGASPNHLGDSDNKGICFFFQAEDGQHIYLHNINVCMFLKEHGLLEFAPHVITAKIVEIETVIMTEVLRKRLRYLQHLPLTCEFQVVELDFKQLISESTLSQFEGEIRKRKAIRNRKARDERKREKRIELEENKKLGKYPKATYDLHSSDQFPAYNPEDFLSLSPPKNEAVERNTISEDVLNSNTDLDTSMPPVQSEPRNAATASFAQMLKDGSKTFVPSPKDNKPNGIIQTPKPQPQNDSDGEGCTPAPEYRQSFSDAIQAALDAVTLQEPTDNPGSSRKKKKGKKQLLFTTSMCRNK